MCMCNKCKKICSGIFLVLGVLFLLRDLKVGDYLGNIQWWTAMFLVAGIAGVGSSMCLDCKACKVGMDKKK